MSEYLHMPNETSETAKRLEHFVQLKSVLIEMEESLGLTDLSERDVRLLCAVVQLRQGRKSDETVGTDEVRDHALCKDLSQPSFYRSLQLLTERGILKRADARAKTVRYTVGL